MLKRLTSPPLFLRYVYAILVTVVVLGLTLVLQPYAGDSPFLFFVAAVALSAWYGGLGPGLVATTLAVMLVEYFLLEPRYTTFARNRDVFQLVIFAFVAFLISWTETHRRRSEEALRQARDELRVILDGVADGITAQDAKGNFVFANQAAASFSGYEFGGDHAEHAGRAGARTTAHV